MTDQQTDINKGVAAVAHIISDVFSPILMPTYGMAVALWLTMMHYLPLAVRLKALAGIFGITALIPFLFIFVMIKIGRINDVSISDHAQRPAPYCVSITCYVGAAFFLVAMNAPLWLPAFYFGAAVVSLLSLLITHWWKISAHAGAAGGLAAGIFWLACNGLLMNATMWVSAVFLLVGFLAWSRLYLGRHTLMQVFAGAMLGFGTVFLIMYLIS